MFNTGIQKKIPASEGRDQGMYPRPGSVIVKKELEYR
jgi:hypothetical protein